jgi:nicotinamidase-related amidase
MDTALLLIDIQNDYFPGGANPLFESVKAAAKASDVIELFRKKGWPVVYIQHLSDRPGATFFAPGTRGAEIAHTVRPRAGEKIVVKHYPNSFRGTELEAHLKGLGVKKLVVCGMMTHMCVDATVRAAKDLGYDVTVVGDACATCDLAHWGEFVPAKEVHRSFLAALAYYYAGVIRADEYIEKNKQGA